MSVAFGAPVGGVLFSLEEVREREGGGKEWRGRGEEEMRERGEYRGGENRRNCVKQL